MAAEWWVSRLILGVNSPLSIPVTVLELSRVVAAVKFQDPDGKA